MGMEVAHELPRAIGRRLAYPSPATAAEQVAYLPRFYWT
jgi:hypothetical protein